MKACAILLLCAAALAADKPPISAASMTLAAQRLDNKLGTVDEAVQPVGVTQGTYIGGFGVVFVGSVSLAPMAGITPFHQSISKAEYARVRQKKLERLPKLRQVIQEQLLNMAASLDTVPADDQIAISVALFSFSGEDNTGIPSQIVMHAPRKVLVDMQTGRVTDRSAIRAEEF
jgi:hypothetical protein